MENCANLGEFADGRTRGLAACSACAGDYEDPDRTALADDLDGSGTEEPDKERTEGGISDAWASTESEQEE